MAVVAQQQGPVVLYSRRHIKPPVAGHLTLHATIKLVLSCLTFTATAAPRQEPLHTDPAAPEPILSASSSSPKATITSLSHVWSSQSIRSTCELAIGQANQRPKKDRILDSAEEAGNILVLCASRFDPIVHQRCHLCLQEKKEGKLLDPLSTDTAAARVTKHRRRYSEDKHAGRHSDDSRHDT